MKFEIFKNKRLQFVLAVIWLIASFLIVRIGIIKAAEHHLQLSLAVCYQNEGLQDCVDKAFETHSKLIQVTLLQLLDMFALFIAPFIFIIVSISLIKWINNYKQKT